MRHVTISKETGAFKDCLSGDVRFLSADNFPPLHESLHEFKFGEKWNLDQALVGMELLNPKVERDKSDLISQAPKFVDSPGTKMSGERLILPVRSMYCFAQPTLMLEIVDFL